MRMERQARSMNQQLLITGGTGYLGRELVAQAQTQGWQVAASYHSQPPATSPAADSPVTWLPLDLRDAAASAAVLQRLQPAVIIHTAFRQSDPDMWAVTALGAQQIARQARALGARLVHLSSDVIFNGEKATPYTEADPPDPIMLYGAAKAAAEALVQSEYPAAALVRTSLIYGFGPLDRHTHFVLAVADGHNPARLFTDEYRCPIFVADLAAAVLELASTSHQGCINLAGAERLSRYDFGCLLAAFHGRNPATIASGLSSEAPGRRPLNCALDTTLARRLLQTPLRGVRAVLAAQQAPSAPSP